jgi:hypothetical protein
MPSFICSILAALVLPIIWIVAVTAAGAQDTTVASLIHIGFPVAFLWFISFLASVVSAVLVRRRIPLWQSAVWVLLAFGVGVASAGQSREIFWRSYLHSIDAKVRPRATALASMPPATWQNCPRIPDKECRTRAAEFRALFPGCQLSREFQGVWLYYRCGTNTQQGSWVVAFFCGGSIYGSGHGCFDSADNPAAGVDKHPHIRDLGNDDWVFFVDLP